MKPVLVEEIYVKWLLATECSLAFRGTWERIAGWWPSEGRAWQLFGEVITEHVSSGKLVMCTSTDPADNPEHHLTLGHSRHSEAAPFLWGRPPLVLRYVTTPAGSIAWRQTLADRQEAADRKATQDAEEQQRRQAHQALIAERVHAAVVGGAATERDMVGATGYSRDEVRNAIHALVVCGRLTYDGRPGWGRHHRWQATAQRVSDGASETSAADQ